MNDPIATLRASLAGRYEIERPIGQGAFATVYLARDLRHDREVALKVLHVDPSTELSERRFLREIRVLARLQHPNILPLYDSGHVLDLLYYVMPFVEGESLRDQLLRQPRQPLHTVVSAGREAADALTCAHRHGVVHRDIKPENILMSGGHVVLADFGIARAADEAGARALTRTGDGSPGTPSYMSPEQMIGERTDARSDIYSLGCVLYEMLTGEPPFRGAAMKRIGERVPPPSVSRPEVPRALDRVICRMLARDRTRRIALAADVVDALDAVARELPEPTGTEDGTARPVTSAASAARRGTPAGVRRSRKSGKSVAVKRLRRPHKVGLALGFAVVAAIVLAFMRTPAAPLPPSAEHAVYAILPFTTASGATLPIRGDDAEILLHESFGRRWKDIRLVGSLLINDACARRGCPPRSRDDARAVARTVGAHIVGWGELRPAGDSTLVIAGLYWVRDGTPISEHTFRVGGSLESVRASFDGIADSLLLGRGLSRELATGAGSTDILAAYEAYRRAHQAIAEWELARAEEELQRAVQLDAQFALAHLWLARVMGLSGSADQRPELWRLAAGRAATLRRHLAPPDTMHALALAALSSDRQPEACAIYRRLIARDSLDFASWYGLGECNRLDQTVVSDRRSPSRWRFRSSYHEAVGAYERALEILPSAHMVFRGRALDRLHQMLFTETTELRAGFAPEADSMKLYAYPAWAGDTLEFIPFPLARIADGTALLNRSPAEQVMRNRGILRRITMRWVDAFPDNADTHEAHAHALEATGEIARRTRGESALAAADRATTLSSDAAQQARLAVLRVRLHLRLGEYEQARQVADSLLAGGADTHVGPSTAIGLSLLTGRLSRTREAIRALSSVEVVGLSTGPPLHLPPSAAEASMRLMVRTAVGGTPDSTRTLAAAANAELLRLPVSMERRHLARGLLLGRALGLAYPAIDSALFQSLDASVHPLLALQQRAARGDTAGIVREFAERRQRRHGSHGGGRSFDAVIREANLLLTLADTGAAIEHLDLALESQGGRGKQLLADYVQAGSFVRSMMLRAELGAAVGDSRTAARWATNVLALWKDADPELQPFVTRMRQLAGSS